MTKDINISIKKLVHKKKIDVIIKISTTRQHKIVTAKAAKGKKLAE